MLKLLDKQYCKNMVSVWLFQMWMAGNKWTASDYASPALHSSQFPYQSPLFPLIHSLHPFYCPDLLFIHFPSEKNRLSININLTLVSWQRHLLQKTFKWKIASLCMKISFWTQVPLWGNEDLNTQGSLCIFRPGVPEMRSVVQRMEKVCF